MVPGHDVVYIQGPHLALSLIRQPPERFTRSL